MSEFGRSCLVGDTCRLSKFVSGLRVRALHAIPWILGKAEDEARATDSRSHTGNIAWRGSPGHGMAARRVRAI